MSLLAFRRGVQRRGCGCIPRCHLPTARGLGGPGLLLVDRAHHQGRCRPAARPANRPPGLIVWASATGPCAGTWRGGYNLQFMNPPRKVFFPDVGHGPSRLAPTSRAHRHRVFRRGPSARLARFRTDVLGTTRAGHRRGTARWLVRAEFRALTVAGHDRWHSASPSRRGLSRQPDGRRRGETSRRRLERGTPSRLRHGRLEQDERRLTSSRMRSARDADAADHSSRSLLRLVKRARRWPRPENVTAWLFHVSADLATSRGRRGVVARRSCSDLPAAETEVAAEWRHPACDERGARGCARDKSRMRPGRPW